MVKPLKTLLVGTSVLTGLSLFAGAPALAADLTGASVAGDHLTNLVNGSSETVIYPNNATNWQAAHDNQGNIELGGQGGSPNVSDFNNPTVLTGDVDGLTATLSSLTAVDWFGADGMTSYGDSDFANSWFGEATAEYGVTDAVLLPLSLTLETLFDAFVVAQGFQRFSDPNIESVSGDQTSGLEITLAGHFDGTPQFFSFLSAAQQAAVSGLLGGAPFQVSEVVKVDYNSETYFAYGFDATQSGVVSKDDNTSHTGNYVLDRKYVPSESVPEPATALSLLAVGGLFAASKHKAGAT